MGISLDARPGLKNGRHDLQNNEALDLVPIAPVRLFRRIRYVAAQGLEAFPSWR